MKKFKILGMNVPSSKNSKSWTGKMLIKSKLCQDYEKWFKKAILSHVDDIKREIDEIGYPVEFHISFAFKDNRRRDLINILQLPMDLFQKMEIIEDDDYKHVVPVFEQITIDKDNPGFTFWITKRTK